MARTSELWSTGCEIDLVSVLVLGWVTVCVWVNHIGVSQVTILWNTISQPYGITQCYLSPDTSEHLDGWPVYLQVNHLGHLGQLSLPSLRATDKWHSIAVRWSSTNSYTRPSTFIIDFAFALSGWEILHFVPRQGTGRIQLTTCWLQVRRPLTTTATK